MLIIGFGCTAQVGKDTAANYLLGKYPGLAERVGFADKVKEVARSLFGLNEEQLYGPAAVKEATDTRYDITPREILQGIGQKMREIYEPVWVDAVFNVTIPELEKAGRNLVLISDVRYPNEADKIHEHGGIVVKVERSLGGTSVGANHSSETSMRNYKNFDYVLENNGSLQDYYWKLDKLMVEVGYNGGETRRY